MPKSKPKTVTCPDCTGRGIRSFGTEDVKCATCDGKGTLDAQEQASSDRS